MSGPLVFAMPGYHAFVEGREPPPDGALHVGRFGDRELRVRVAGSVADRACALIGSVSPENDALLQVMLAAEALKAHGASHVTAVLPYLAYARSDVPDVGGVQSIALIGRALECAGVDDAVTVDVHSPRAAMLFPIPLISLSPAEVLAAGIAGDFELDAVVAPDKGAFPRARALADALGLDDPLSAAQVSGARRALVVDDIIDTGATLSACCSELVAHGVEQIVIAVTHGVFAGSQWHELLQLPVRALYTTDTIPYVHRDRPYLARVVSIVPLVAHFLEHPALALD